MTSSPANVSEEALDDKLSATALAPPQDAQDAPPMTNQAHAKQPDIDVSDHAEGYIDVQPNNATSNATSQEGTTVEQPEAELNRHAHYDPVVAIDQKCGGESAAEVNTEMLMPHEPLKEATSEEQRSRELASAVSRPTPSRAPQEITLAELKAQKAALLASLATLPAIQVLIEENASSQAELSDGDGEPTDTDIMAAANKIVKDHIKLLHEYNELKDVGQGLMGLIADQRGVRIVEVQDEFGIDAQD